MGLSTNSPVSDRRGGQEADTGNARAVSSPARSSGIWGQTGLPANFRQKAPEIHGSLVARAFVGTWGQTGLPANFRQKAPKTHGSLVARAFVGDLRTDGAASEFPAKGAGNPWQSRQSPD